MSRNGGTQCKNLFFPLLTSGNPKDGSLFKFWWETLAVMPMGRSFKMSIWNKTTSPTSLCFLSCSLFENGRPLLLRPPKPVPRPGAVCADVRPSSSGWRFPGKQQQKGAAGDAHLRGWESSQAVCVCVSSAKSLLIQVHEPLQHLSDNSQRNGAPFLNMYCIGHAILMAISWEWRLFYSGDYIPRLWQGGKLLSAKQVKQPEPEPRSSGAKPRSLSTRFHQTHSLGRNSRNQKRSKWEAVYLHSWANTLATGLSSGWPLFFLFFFFWWGRIFSFGMFFEL